MSCCFCKQRVSECEIRVSEYEIRVSEYEIKVSEYEAHAPAVGVTLHLQKIRLELVRLKITPRRNVPCLLAAI